MKKVLTLFTVLLIKSSLCAAVWPAVATNLTTYDSSSGPINPSSPQHTGVATNSYVTIVVGTGENWIIEGTTPLPGELSQFNGAVPASGTGSDDEAFVPPGTIVLTTPGTYQMLLTWLGPPTGTLKISYSIALPVTLAYFRVEKEENSALILWETASEINSSHFEIETSLDGRKFFKIGEVDAAGKAAKYSYLDKNVLDGLYYYRLKQVDNDGTFEYSGIRNVHLEESGNTIVYPVPTTSLLFVKGNVSGNISLHTMQGKKIQVPIEQNDIYIKISLENIQKGFYLLKIGDREIKRIMKI